jgi:hypothetical protein
MACYRTTQDDEDVDVTQDVSASHVEGKNEDDSAILMLNYGPAYVKQIGRPFPIYDQARPLLGQVTLILL